MNCRTNVLTVLLYRHVDLYYEDGGNPTEEILQAFLQICETERGAIAVHCKAGLGRTGTNIAAYMIKHYGYTAKETMAWCRCAAELDVVADIFAGGFGFYRAGTQTCSG
jgi:protein-tyrosine phosphatase